MDFIITVPQGCACQDVAIGSYGNQEELPTPEHMLSLGSVGCYEFRPTLCIDRCMVPVIKALWERKVVTLGCCCGHNVRDGYIQVINPQPSANGS